MDGVQSVQLLKLDAYTVSISLNKLSVLNCDKEHWSVTPYIYLRHFFSKFSATVAPILEAVTAPFGIIGKDGNAKSQLWNSTSSEKRVN